MTYDEYGKRVTYAGAGDDDADEGEVGGNKYVGGDDDLVAKKYICSVWKIACQE